MGHAGRSKAESGLESRPGPQSPDAGWQQTKQTARPSDGGWYSHVLCTRVHLQIVFDQSDDALKVIGRTPRGEAHSAWSLKSSRPPNPPSLVVSSPQAHPRRPVPPPGGDVLQGLLLLVLLGEPGKPEEEFVHLLDGKEALGSWGERLALLKEDSDGL